MLKDHYAKLKEHWTNLAPREKKLVMFGSVVIGICFLYFCLFSPFLEHVHALREQVTRQQKTLVWMRSADQTIQKMEKESHHQIQSVSPTLLLGMIQKQIKQSELSQSLSQLKQNSNHAIEMHFQKVKFDALMLFLISLVKEQNILISQMSVTAENTSGLVNADLTVTSSP